MFKQPESASELIAQLPSLARFGLARFARPNNEEWRLTCDYAEGAEGALWSRLVDARYDELISLALRRQLHQLVQRQLQSSSHYRLSYSLNTPRGPLKLLEIGEHTGDWLQGYLLAQQPTPISREGICLSAIEQSAQAFLLVDTRGRITYANPSLCTITHYSLEELLGRRLAELPPLDSVAELFRDAMHQRPEHASWTIEFPSHRKNLEPYWGRVTISRVRDENGRTSHFSGLWEDITLSKLNQQQYQQQALTDSLTGLGNREYFLALLQRRLEAKRPAPFSVLLIDIDNFKRINDSLGHETGDKLLISLARRLRNSLASTTSLSRFASNEFAVLLDAETDQAAEDIAQQLLQLLDLPLFVANQLITVTATLGLAFFPRHGDEAKTLTKHASLALHKAKEVGKSRLQVFTENLNSEADYNLFIESNLRHVLDRNELELYYQPKLCLGSKRLIGLEALLRWRHPVKGLISPDKFIGLAEDTGLIVPIGQWVIRESCRMLHHLQAAGRPDLRIAINLSPRQFHDEHLVSSIEKILREEHADATRLELELTESLLLDFSTNTFEQLTRLKALGFTLAMDDFGTGYSSLSYLKKFPLDVIKIDRSFIKDIPDSQDDMEITSAVIAMAHKLKLQVVAEGIETDAQLAFLQLQHCNLGQGFLFDRPIAGSGLLEHLQRYPA
ncbi:EAL domain-containing protein [Pseudomonas sp.]|uniref:putative bifunctional diguanylate cyclase/phosphodiesterase n=1 Tax=Pseudomonas sp. TaxID=306 RepID=UPI0019E8FF38|nr:EAL domain-containing protein [Pseudomonas sp.]MBF0676463.1 EAL domain-containing protein [Pseudomonas sp.]